MRHSKIDRQDIIAWTITVAIVLSVFTVCVLNAIGEIR